MSKDELVELYTRVMHPLDLSLDDPNARFTVRVYDGGEHCWCDCYDAINVNAEDALKAWAGDTKNGTKYICFDDFDYYRIFPANTRMIFDGRDGDD